MAQADSGEMARFLMRVGPFLLGLLLSVFLLSGLTAETNVNMVVGVGNVAWRNGLLALCWWLGAWGFGFALTRFAIGPSIRAITRAASGRGGALAEHTTVDEAAIALGLGASLMLVFDAALGSLGLLVAAKGLVAWILVAVGVIAGVRVLREAPIEGDGDDDAEAGTAPDNDAAPRRLSLKARIACAATCGVLTGLLLVAASVAPGWLWSSEMAGYDALSYHLMLPKMWFFSGGTVTSVDGNVYSALPSYVESAFLHLMVMRGTPFDGAFACQWWAVGATLATAFCVARLARACVGPAAGWMAAIVFLSTPWTTVVGTLAYNDMFPCLALAAGWLLAGPVPSEDRRLDARTVIALALLAAASFGAKPSSVLFTALPLAVIAFSTGSRNGRIRNLRYVPIAVVVGLILLAPWLVRNQLTYGSPTFPFLSGIFGLGPWTEEQMKVFLGAHGNPDGLGAMSMIWQQWLGYGFGPKPDPNEPWFPLWGVLPIVGLAGLAVAAKPPVGAQRWWAVVALSIVVCMVVAWILFTHVKSRFLLPAAVPLAIGATVLLGLLTRRTNDKLAAGVLVIGAALPIFNFMREPVRGDTELRAPAVLVDGITQRTGEALAQAMNSVPKEQQSELLKQADSTFMVNFALPPEAKIVGIGYSTPFYLSRPVSWCTVWDRGVFDKVVDESPGTPESWGTRLRSLGYTHAIIDPVMLSVWTRSGWLNPALASGNWSARFASANTLFAQTIDGKFILQLTPPPPQAPVQQQPIQPQPLQPLGTPPGLFNPGMQPNTPGSNGGLFTPPISGG